MKNGFPARAAAFALAAITAILLCLPLSAASGERPRATAEFGAPVIDGAVGSEWSGCERYPVRLVDLGLIPSDTDTDGEFCVMWSHSYIYICVVVDKHGVPVRSDLGVTDNDSVEFDITDLGIFDGTGNVGDEKSPFAGGFRVGSDGALSGFGGYYSIIADRVSAAASLLGEDRYAVEIAVPWFNATPLPGHVFSLEVQLNDNNGGTRDGLVTWASTPCFGWNSSSVHGAVTLAAPVETELPTSPPPAPPTYDQPISVVAIIAAVAGVGMIAFINRRRKCLPDIRRD